MKRPTDEDPRPVTTPATSDSVRPGAVFRPAQTEARPHPTDSITVEVLAELPFHNGGRLIVSLKQGEHGHFVDVRKWVVRRGTLVPGKGISIHASNVKGVARALTRAARMLGETSTPPLPDER